MTDRELEMRVQQAFDAATPDIFDSVMAECSAPRGKVVALTKSRKKKSGFAKRLLSIAAVMALLVCAAAGGAYVSGQENAVASVVTLDVNPSVELRLNARDKVVDAAAPEIFDSVMAECSAPRLFACNITAHLGWIVGTAVGAMIGAVLLQTITFTLGALGVSQFWQQAVAGALLVIAIAFDRLVAHRSTHRATRLVEVPV